MYTINVNHKLNSSPWDICCDERIIKLDKYINAGYKINLIIYESPDSSTFRYRGYNIYQMMEKSSQWKSIYFFANEIKRITSLLSKVSLVTISRVKWSFALQDFIDLVRKYNIKLAFDVDDRVFDLDYLPIMLNTLNIKRSSDYECEYWFSYISKIGFTASKADVFITTNEFLLKALQNKYNKPGYVIPNFLNNEQIDISNRCLEIKNKKSSKRPFTLGYFSGSPTHINDFKVIYKEVMQLMEDYPDINLKVVGFMEFPADMQEYIKKGRITFSKLVDFIRLQELVASVDVNIVPLIVNDFTNCKSELKYFEASIVNTITCASPTYTYKNSIIDGTNGFLCEQSQWYDKILSIYHGKINDNQIRSNAYTHSINNYYGDKILNHIENTYNQIVDRKRS